MVASEVHGEPAHDDGHGGVRTRRDQKERGVLGVSIVVHDHEDGEAGDGNEDGDYGEEESVAEAVREGGDQHAESEGACPWRDRVELRLDVTVAVGLDDGGREIRVAVSCEISDHVSFFGRDIDGGNPKSNSPGTINPKYMSHPRMNL